MTWFRFYDMHAGGHAKSDFALYWVKAETEELAIAAFTAKTGLDPFGSGCGEPGCCGDDFSVWDSDEGPSAEEVARSGKGDAARRLGSETVLIIDATNGLELMLDLVDE